MPRISITPTAAPGSYPLAIPTVSMTVISDILGAQFVSSGNDLVLVRNPTGASITATLKGIADPFNRSVDLPKVILAAGYALIGPVRQVGWMQTGGLIWIDVTAVGLEM